MKTKISKKAVWAIATAVVAAVIIIAAIIWFMRGNTAGDDKNVVYVNAVKDIMAPGAGVGRIDRFSGVVETQKQIDIQLAQDRTIREVLVEEGQDVSEGTVLFTYDTDREKDELEKAKLELERTSNMIENKNNEIGTLEAEKRNAGSDAQLEYTMQIQSAQMELKQSEYEYKTKEMEIQKLEDSIANSEVKSQMSGVVKSINNGEQQYMYGEPSQAFMTIIALGDYRIKCKINEQNVASVMPGRQVIVHSRIDDDVVWNGTMGEVDMQKPENGNNNYYGGDPAMQSSSYPFYVELESSQGLMLGQHVYAELDNGQEEEKKGVWLDESFVVMEEENPYVWADNGKGKLEKRKVELGEHDDELFRYEIVSGLDMEDMITFPEIGLEKGMKTAKGQNSQMGMSNPPQMPDGGAPENGETIPEGEDVMPEGGEAAPEGENIIGGMEDTGSALSEAGPENEDKEAGE